MRLLADAANSGRLFNDLHQRLILLAEHAYSLRDMKSVQEVSELLLNLPTIEAHSVGEYYQALVHKRGGRADEAQAILERVADYAPLGYRARAMQTLGVIRHEQGHIDDALRFYLEASHATSFEPQTLLTNLLINLQISVIKGSTGDHKGAIDYLRNLSPLVRLVANQRPLYLYFYHNALAVEFAESGRLIEAEVACAIAVGSPYAHAYPEWSATRDEIAAKRRIASPSIVAIQRAPQAKPATQAEPRLTLKSSKGVTSSRPANTFEFFQRSVIPIPAIAAIALNAVSTLDRVLACIGPRAPPSLL